MSICYDCAKERNCRNKPLWGVGCRKYEGDKYWCVSSDKYVDFYAKAETASKAKGAMWAAIQKQEEYEYHKTSFYDFVHSGLYVMQVDRLTYECHKIDGWCK
jgi:hypothetical protein